MKFCLTVMVVSAVLFAAPAEAQRATNIQARTAGELAELCAANPREAMGDARINFCHGFAQGAILAALYSNQSSKPFCFPNPAPTRTATMTEFENWVRAEPARKSMPAVEGLLRFLGERFPCK